MLEGWEYPKKEVKDIYCFDIYGNLSKIKASLLGGVSFVKKSSGEVMTCRGFANGDLYGCEFYKSEKDLLNSIGHGENI